MKNMLHAVTCGLLLLMLGSMLCLSEAPAMAVAAGPGDSVNGGDASWLAVADSAMAAPSGTGTAMVAAPAAPGFEGQAWDSIEGQARGTTVRFYMYGGFTHVNRWIDGWVAKRLRERYDIVLERVPMDAAVFVNRLLAEKAAHRERGSMDLLWINGENFRNARQAGLLWGPFSQVLPSLGLVEPSRLATDFGYPVDGYEAPWGSAQLVLEYDAARTPHPPRSAQELLEWVHRNPGRFTYPQPPDFTGSAFVRQLFYALTGGHEQYGGAFDQAVFDAKAPALWDALRGMAPDLWQGGRAYPHDAATQDALFARGEVDFSISYHPAHAQANIREGVYPPTVRTTVFRDGSIRNTHFVAVPYNAPNKAGALVVAEFLLSPEAQLSKLDPANWGDFPVLDIARLSAAMQARFKTVDLGGATLSPAELGAVAVPEVPAAWLEAIERGWNFSVPTAAGNLR